MNKAEYIIMHVFGGIRPMARTLGHESHLTVNSWKKRGRIPGSRQLEISRAAKSNGLDLSAEDLILASSHLPD